MPDQTDTTPIALSPSTYDRHAAAVEYVEGQVRTRDPRWGTGRFPGIIPGRWAILASGDTITGASGITLGIGTVKLCSVLGGVENPDETVTVANAGPEIVASQDTIVRLGWTAGTWCVTCAGSVGAYA